MLDTSFSHWWELLLFQKRDIITSTIVAERRTRALLIQIYIVSIQPIALNEGAKPIHATLMSNKRLVKNCTTWHKLLSYSQHSSTWASIVMGYAQKKLIVFLLKYSEHKLPFMDKQCYIRKIKWHMCNSSGSLPTLCRSFNESDTIQQNNIDWVALIWADSFLTRRM